MRSDYAQHLTVSFVLTMASILVGLIVVPSISTASASYGAILFIGALREVAQWMTRTFEWAYKLADRWSYTRWAMIGQPEWTDMLCNFTGATAAYTVALVFLIFM